MVGQVDGGTIVWWLQQSNEARLALCVGNVKLREALLTFTDWYGGDKDVPVWGNGAAFDNVIVRQAYERLYLHAPWSHRADRCFRTLKNLFPGVEPPEQSGTHHNALDDAMWQAEYMRLIFQGGTCSG
jgi:exodeoxyribonuclease VIII